MSSHQIAGVGQEIRIIDPYRINRIENRYQVGSDPLVFVDMPPKDVCLHIDKACQFIRHKAVQIEHGVRIGLIRYFLLVGKANLLEVLIGFTPERGTPGIIQFVNSAVFLL